MPERSTLVEPHLHGGVAMLLAGTRLCAWLLLVVGLLTLGYAFFAEFTLRLFRGGAIETGIGVFGLVWTSAWRRKLTPSSR